MWGENDQKKDSDDDSSEEDSSEESEEEDDSDGNGKGVAAVAAASREDRKKEKKARKEAAIARAKGQAVQVGDLPSSDDESEDEALPANPNHSRAARSQTKAPAAKVDVDSAANAVKEMSISSSAAPQSRRERESMEAQLAKERYRKLHEQGKTDEAKADLARLKIIREKRAAEAARKQVRCNCLFFFVSLFSFLFFLSFGARRKAANRVTLLTQRIGREGGARGIRKGPETGDRGSGGQAAGSGAWQAEEGKEMKQWPVFSLVAWPRFLWPGEYTGTATYSSHHALVS